jgi:hypothetical protein
LKLLPLEMRRRRGDLIETYKIMTGKENIDRNEIFTCSETTRTRGHNMKLYLPKVRLNIRKFSFSHRVINEWNQLPQEAVSAPTINSFKNHVDRHLHRLNNI